MIPSDTTLAYIAGIVDGDGSICILKTKGRTTKVGEMKAVISNTNKELLEFVQLYFGGSICAVNSRINRARGRKTCYQWVVPSRKALYFLESIEPFLRVKKMQAQIAIEYQHQRRNKGCRLTEEESAIAEAQRILVCGLNKKGGKGT